MGKSEAFMTVPEMRANKDAVRARDIDPKDGKAKSRRFEGSTRPDFVRELVSKDATVLECGPITGALTLEMQKDGYQHISTLDIVDLLELPDRSKLEHIGEVDFNRDTFPHADSTFDAVVSFGLAEHLENPFHFSREVARVLKPGGTFIMAVPNVFHIISRLVFLRRGMFPRWSFGNNHISILPHGVFEKTVLRDFELVETRYYKPDLKPFLSERIAQKLLPTTQWFGDYVAYVLRAKK
jgi:2-polyprenyl-3-methyl-5-hydroxy-6-metoxy-1,4-benzoquinol methylase